MRAERRVRPGSVAGTSPPSVQGQGWVLEWTKTVENIRLAWCLASTLQAHPWFRRSSTFPVRSSATRKGDEVPPSRAAYAAARAVRSSRKATEPGQSSRILMVLRRHCCCCSPETGLFAGRRILNALSAPAPACAFALLVGPTGQTGVYNRGSRLTGVLDRHAWTRRSCSCRGSATCASTHLHLLCCS